MALRPRVAALRCTVFLPRPCDFGLQSVVRRETLTAHGLPNGLVVCLGVDRGGRDASVA